MAQASRDENNVPTLLGVSDADGVTPVVVWADPTTHRLLVNSTGGGGGSLTVEEVDGSPTVPDVNTIIFPNGSVTDDGGGVVTITVSGSGDVSGPASSTDNALVVFDGTSGKIIKNSTVLISNVVTPSSTNTFTNKTYDTAGAGNSFSINGLAATANTGTGAVVRATSPTLVTPALGTPSSGTLTNATGLPIVNGTTGTLSVARGGTGVTTISATSIWVANLADTITEVTPTALQSVRINAAGTDWEAYTPNSGVQSLITVANEATDTSCFVAFFTDATGNLQPKTNANLTFNSNTGVLTSASSILTTTDINGGTIDGTIIGGSSAAAITGTTITVETNLVPDANDGAGLGISGTAFSDLFLASGAVINFDAGNSVITHSSAVLTVSTGDLRVTTAGTNTASVVTVGGTQTLTNKTLTTPTIGDFSNATHNHSNNAGGGQLDDNALVSTADVKIASVGVTIDGGGSAITTGVKGYIMVPYNCTINSVTMLADQSGSIVVDIWKDTYANFPPTVADTITASAKPTISAANKSQDATLTGWTTTITAGDILAFNVDSATTITRLNLILKVTKS